MSNLFLSIGGAKSHWIQHNIPWLAVLALALGVWRDEAEPGDRAGFDG